MTMPTDGAAVVPLPGEVEQQLNKNNGHVNVSLTVLNKGEGTKSDDVSKRGCSACCEACQRKRIPEKVMHTLSTVSIIFLALSTLHYPWLLLYFYTAVFPPLFAWRIYSYTKLKDYLFLIDPCYFINVYCLIAIWAFPSNPEVFRVLFALCNGPLLGATIIYRNSLVFHNVDRLTSAFIHIVPPLCTFVIRWFPSVVSPYWYTAFDHGDMSTIDPLWNFGVPLGSLVFHMILYIIIVFGIVKPGDGVGSSLQYLTRKKRWTFKLLLACGEKGKIWMYYFIQFAVQAVSISITLLCFSFFEAHCALIILSWVVINYNGGTWYIDLFGKAFFKEDAGEAIDDDSEGESEEGGTAEGNGSSKKTGFVPVSLPETAKK